MKLKTSDISIQQIAQIYDSFLVGKTLRFDVRHKNTPFIIKFDEGHLGHLLAMHKFGYHKFGCKGAEELYKPLLDGFITWELLEHIDSGVYKEHMFRILYFQFVGDILDSPKIAIFDSKKNKGVMKADFFFYNERYKRYLSLGIRKEKGNSEFYAPITFLEGPKNKWAENVHIPLQNTVI